MSAAADARLAIQENVPLAPLTTLGVGGAARYYVRLEREADLPLALEFAEQRGLEAFALGGGSNLLVGDAGFQGLVAHVALRGVVWEGAEATAAAGENWDDLVAASVARECAGIECLSGIPGSVGATPIQNVGAYGQEVADTLVAARVWDRVARTWREIPAAECGFGYRSSRFNGAERGRYIVTAVRFGLRAGGEAKIEYAELRRRFPEGATASPAEARRAVLELRAGKGMVLAPGRPESRSAGSFFKNPVVSAEQAEAIAARAGAAPPRFETPAGVKLSAAWLIERAGFGRGFRPTRATGEPGPVGLSPLHALAILAYEGARAADVEALAETIRAGVFARFGVRLEREPARIGSAAPTRQL